MKIFLKDAMLAPALFACAKIDAWPFMAKAGLQRITLGVLISLGLTGIARASDLTDLLQHTLDNQGITASELQSQAATEDSILLRYRPILMTALATIAGMVPIAMQRAIGLERLSPLADAAIGGLLIGTFLSLFYLPMLYIWVTGNIRHRSGG